MPQRIVPMSAYEGGLAAIAFPSAALGFVEDDSPEGHRWVFGEKL